MSVKGVWITWEIQRRNKGISSALGWDLYEIAYDNPRIIRYLKSLYKTLRILIKEKPNFVAAQNPSLLLALTVIFLKYIFGYKTVIDAHNAGLFPLENRSRFLNIVSRITQSLSDWTIVTNDALAKVVFNNNGRAIVLPDKLPVPPNERVERELNGETKLAFICSFSEDEPYHEVIEAAKLLPENIHIYITGKFNGKVNENQLPSNVKLLGFIPDKAYWSLISSVDGIIVLTTREDCLVCGAYEAVALKRPMILSKTRVIMNYFSTGCLYAEPSVIDIQRAILEFVENKEKLSTEVIDLEEKLKKEWEDDFAKLLKVIAIE